MLDRSVGFVGGGRVTRIVLGRWAATRTMPRHTAVFDPDRGAREALCATGAHIEVAETAAGAAGQDVVFLAVHPPTIKEAAAAIQAALKPGAIVVSFAPKFTIATLSGLLGGFSRIARLIPNAPSYVGEGYNPVAYGTALSDRDRHVVRAMFDGLGEMPEVPEAHLEAYAILTAMGPTYFWPQLYELVSLGESFGLGHVAARDAVSKMLKGAIAIVDDAGLSPEQVQDLIPVKPVAYDVAALVSAYRGKLSALMEKIRP